MIFYVLEIQFAVDDKQLREVDSANLMSLFLFCLPFLFRASVNKFFLKEPGSRYFRLAGHMVSVATTCLCLCSVKATIDTM